VRECKNKIKSKSACHSVAKSVSVSETENERVARTKSISGWQESPLWKRERGDDVASQLMQQQKELWQKQQQFAAG